MVGWCGVSGGGGAWLGGLERGGPQMLGTEAPQNALQMWVTLCSVIAPFRYPRQRKGLVARGWNQSIRRRFLWRLNRVA